MSPVKSAFQERLEIYRQQKEEVAKDEGRAAQLKKRRADFQQQRGIGYQQVENIASTTTAATLLNPRLAANTLSAPGVASTSSGAGSTGLTGAEAFRNVKASATDVLRQRQQRARGPETTTGGSQNLIGPRVEWRTSGYQASVVPTPPQAGLAPATPEPKKKKAVLKPFWERQNVPQTLGSTLAMRETG